MVNIRVVSRVAEKCKTCEFKKIEYFKKLLEMLGMDGKVLSQPFKAIGCEMFHKKIMLLNFVDLSTIFCAKLSADLYFHL